MKLNRKHVLSGLLAFAVSVALAILYVWLFTAVTGHDLPKTALLKRTNARWQTRMEVMNHQMDGYDKVLSGLEAKDDKIYRSMFGLKSLSESDRNGTSSGLSRYPEGLDPGSELAMTALRLDSIARRVNVQSNSFLQIQKISATAGDMASCIPAIPPVNPDKRTVQPSSGFGGRADPILHGQYRMHNGFDFATHKGTPVYATGDGVIETVDFQFFGYGINVVINHGFGYKTRYAHLSNVIVVEGMKVKRGDCIGYSGNTGRSTGPHLHYEVIYKGNVINPANFFDLDMSSSEYASMVHSRSEESVVDTKPKRLHRTH